MHDTLGHPSGGSAIALRGVNLSLGGGAARVHILRDIDLNIGRGEAVALLGPSGSGKSTLLMVMTGLERANSGSIVAAGEDLSKLDEDALARFRGKNIGIVFQAFHLIPTMTALENVAVPLELAGVDDAFGRAERELIAVGLGGRLSHYPAQLSGGEQQRVALARAVAPNPAILVADEPTGNLDEATGSEIIELLFHGYRQHGTTLVLVTHDIDAGATLRPGAADPFGTAGGTRLTRGEAPMTPLALRYAWRELRGGLRGFGVFIACIALGVMAIAGVGSVAQSLADGLSQAGSAILGGDLNFSLVQREATDGERRFLDAHGKVAVIATLPTMARANDGRTTLVEIKAVDGAYPLFGAVTAEPDLPLADLFERNGDAFGAAADPALLTRLDLKLGDRITVGKATIELRSVLKNEPDRLSGGIGFGPRLLVSQEALRASALLQPGSLVRWQYRLRLPASNATDGAVVALERRARSDFPNAGWDVRTRKKASPQLERNVERFSQFLTLVALTALLVGRRRRRQCGRQSPRAQARRDRDHESFGRHRHRHIRHLLRADPVGRVVRDADRRGHRRRFAVRHRRSVRQHHSASGRAGFLSR